MPAQALYRKWRPQLWEEVVGQDHVVRTLKNAIARNRIVRKQRATRSGTRSRIVSAPRPTPRPVPVTAAANAGNDDAPKQHKPVPGPLVSSDGAAFGGAFSAARGKLPWPVDGRLLARFGETRGDDTRAKWDGVMISASAGSQVHAVHGGRVVFADWLRGAGLLVILDHGNGYLSLYGHNQSLLKDAGQIVKAGEAIATVGTSGGQNTPALYFAIRQQGRPSDPAQWCRRQG